MSIPCLLVEGCLYKRFKCFKIFNEFLRHLFKWREGGAALMHVYVWEYIVSLNYRTAWWMFTTFCKDEVLMVPHLCLGYSANSAQGWIQGGAKIGQWGVPSPKDFSFRLESYSNKPNAWQWSKGIWKEALLFWFHSEVKYLTRFWRIFGLSYFGVFQCNFYRFVYIKVLYLHLFCVIDMFIKREMLI